MNCLLQSIENLHEQSRLRVDYLVAGIIQGDRDDHSIVNPLHLFTAEVETSPATSETGGIS
jgi:hypothetical protein